MAIQRLQRYTNPFQNVVASGVASTFLNTGRTVEDLQLRLAGTTFTKAMITDIKVRANAKVIFNMSGPQLDKINAFRGETTETNYLDIPFADIVGLTEGDRMVGALDTSDIGSLTAEVTIAGATAPQLTAISFESAPQALAGSPSNAVAAKLLSKFLRYPYQTSAGGQLSIPLPFNQVGSRIKRLHIEQVTGNITGVTVKQDGNVIHESIKLENEHELKRWKRVPQALWYSIDFGVDGNFAKWFDTRSARTIDLLPTFSAADSGFVIVEFIDELGNL